MIKPSPQFPSRAAAAMMPRRAEVDGRDFGFVARCAEAIKAEWARINDLAPTDGADGGKDEDPTLGNSSGPATAG